jgi:hypothetical protein
VREIRTLRSMSGDGKRDVAAWAKLPRPSSTLPKRTLSGGAASVLFSHGKLLNLNEGEIQSRRDRLVSDRRARTDH